MATRFSFPGGGRIRARRERRTRRLLATKAIRDALVSLVGLLGRPVSNPAGREIGRLDDIIARWDGQEDYPPITALVVRIGRRLTFVPADYIDEVTHEGVRLNSARLDLVDFERRPGEVRLAKDVLDRQLVDVDGVHVIRAADLYLAPVNRRILLVGVDVSVSSLLRRIGPGRLRTRPTPERVIDWAAIQPFGDPVAQVPLRVSHEGLRRLRPSELANLLEDLGRPQRQELLDVLEPETAADALEEMDPEELETLLREAEPQLAAELVAAMEPDEAVEALRDLAEEERDELLARMPDEASAKLHQLLDYEEDTAGGVMTPNIVVLPETATVRQARQELRKMHEHKVDVDAVAVVDGDGRLICDVPLFDLVLGKGNQPLSELSDEVEPVTVEVDAPFSDVAEKLTEARRSSVLVVDAEKRPIGRILADDVVDALTPERGRFHFPRLLQ